MAGKFKRGSRVILSSPRLKDEEGLVIAEEKDFPGMYIVDVGPKFPLDDGIREVAEEYMRSIL